MRLAYLVRTLTALVILGCASPLARAQNTVIISEFLASNSNGLEDEDGDTSDWIEIYNAGSNTVNLAGWHLTDDAADLTKWQFPATNLPPQGFLLVFASGKNRGIAGAPLHTSFSLDAAGEYLGLIAPDGQTVASAFAPRFPEQQPNISHGIAQTTQSRVLLGSAGPVRWLIPSNGTLGLNWTQPAFDAGAWRLGTNGVGYETSVPGFLVRNFKANVTVDSLTRAEAVITTPAQQSRVIQTNSGVVNYLNTGESAHYGADQTFPGFSIGSDVEDFVVEATGRITIPAAGYWTFGVNSDDGFKLDVGSFTVSYAAPRGPGDTLAAFNFPAPGDYPIRLVYYERGGGAEVELFAAQGNYTLWSATAFRLVGDVAQGGLAVRSTPAAGQGSLGFRSWIGTDVQRQMLSNAASAYLRYSFNQTQANSLDSLWLQIRYDDGFVAYLNGQEIVRRNAPTNAAWNSLAGMSRPNALAVTAEHINLSEARAWLQEGANVLAIHGLNDSATSADFLVQAELIEYSVTLLTNQHFSTPSPGTWNTSGFFAFVADTKFSRNRGFYDTPFTCEITTETPGATIRYTLDGSTPSLTNGLTYSAPLTISNTTTLRAAAFKAGYRSSDVDTQTYIFVDDVIKQSSAGQAPSPAWPAPRTSGGQVYDYGMDPDVVNSTAYRDTIKDDLRSLPTFSIVTDLPHLFDPARGIYANPGGDEISWERPCSLELLNPDGNDGFQVNCGIRIRGGFSRSQDNPKHAFRFFFREEYGASKLRYPLFGAAGADSFDKIDLRTMQNYSWAFQNDGRMIALRDVFSRDTQRDMGQPYTRGDFYHLYINGQYWGLYNIEERPEAAFGETYFGGQQEDYDVVKVDPDLGYQVEATDGNLDAWFRLWMAATNGFASTAAYERVQGNNPDGTRNPAYENLLDVDNLIDYMLVIIYAGNLDAPISAFLQNDAPNNFFAMRSRNGTAGFRFFAHDSEHTLLNAGEDRTGFANGQISADWTAGNPLTQIVSGAYNPAAAPSKSNPQYVWFQLQQNPEFRLRVADHVQKHFFNNGVLTVEGVRSRLLTRSNEIHRAIVAESARWGDAKGRTPPFQRTDWLAALNTVMTGFVPQRSGAVLNQLRTDGLYPTIAAPVINHFGGLVPPGFSVTLTNVNASGTIYYTLDGSDPRVRGGAVSSRAIAYAAPITLQSHTVIRARVLVGTTWSALVEATFYVQQDFSALQVTEIMFNPPAKAPYTSDELEFIEFRNAGLRPLDLSSVAFTAGITFTFTNGTVLPPGAFFVLARNVTAFSAIYTNATVNGTYTGQLANGGEGLRLTHPLGGVVLSFDYTDDPPWPVTADGLGYSLVPLDQNSNPNPTRGANWRASAEPGGSPGVEDPTPMIPVVLINEVLTHTELPAVDAVELFNPNPFAVDVSGWFLTDDASWPKRYRIAEGTSIGAGGFLVLDESHFNSSPAATNSFAFSSQGDAVYLFSGDAQTNLTGYSHGFQFGAAATGVSFARFLNSAGEEQFAPQASLTLGQTNASPESGPILIREIMYHPPDLAGALDNQQDEYIVLWNPGPVSQPLFDPAYPTNTWQIRGAVQFVFPTNTWLASNAALVVVSFDPGDEALLNAFRSKYPALASTDAYGPYGGKLDNSRERVQLYRPDTPVGAVVPYVWVDSVEYGDVAPWPPSADGAGAALKRAPDGYGNDPGSWSAVVPLTVTESPQSVSARIGQAVAFSIEAYGQGPVRYQWHLNGVPIPNATNSVLSVTNISPDHVGLYNALLVDDGSIGWSAGARLQMLMPPTIVEHPESVIAVAGDRVALRVGVTNLATLPVTYRWRKNALTLSNTMVTLESYNNTLEFPSVAMTNAGTYAAVAANSVQTGGLLSGAAWLTVVTPPLSQVVNAGTNAAFVVNVAGPGYASRPVPVAYQWAFNGQFISDATNSQLALAEVRAADVGTYAVTVLIGTNLPQASATYTASLSILEPDDDADGIPNAWETSHGLLPSDPADAGADLDNDGHTNLQEFIAGTDPRDADSCLRIHNWSSAGARITFEFEAISNRSYQVFTAREPINPSWSNLLMVSPAHTNRSISVTNSPAGGKAFYRIMVPSPR